MTDTILRPNLQSNQIIEERSDDFNREHPFRVFPSDYQINKHQELLARCSTKWFVSIFCDDKNTVVMDQDNAPLTETHTNHCNCRDCVPCSPHRIGQNKKRLKPYFEIAERVGHTVLTKPNVKKITKSIIRKGSAEVKKFIRNINKKSNGRYYGIWVIEIKYQPARDDWHVHWHLFFFNSCPHRLTVKREWAKIQGRVCQTFVKYNSRMSEKQNEASKKSLLNYAAKRSANAGLIDNKTPLPVIDYLTLIYRTRIYSKFGLPAWFEAKAKSILEVLAISEPELRDRYTEIPLLLLAKPQDVPDPPPDLANQVMDALKSDDCFTVKKTVFGTVITITFVTEREFTDYFTTSGGLREHTHRELDDQQAHRLYNQGVECEGVIKTVWE